MPSTLAEHQIFTDLDGKPLVNGSVYYGVQNQDPVLNPISIYSDRGLTTTLDNPQPLDAYGKTLNKVWVAGKYSIRVDDSTGSQVYQELDAGDTTETGITNLTNVAGTNTITAEGSPVVLALTDNQQYNFRAAAANTGAVTLQIDLTAAKSIKKQHDVDLVSGDIEANQTVSVIYNATDDTFELVSNVVGGKIFSESADHLSTPVAGFGEIWVRNDTPNVLMFTDDAGNDYQISSTPPAPAGYDRFGKNYIVDGSSSAPTSLGVSTDITVSTFETVGPTGSGATNIWTAMDAMPTNATAALFRVLIQLNLTSTGTRSVDVFGASNATASPLLNTTASGLVTHGNDADSGDLTEIQVNCECPVDSSQIMKIGWAVSGTATSTETVTLYWRGWVID